MYFIFHDYNPVTLLNGVITTEFTDEIGRAHV